MIAAEAAMPLRYLDHVNVRTARLAEMTTFYSTVLGLAPGERPPFRFDGAWLYAPDGRAAVHLVAVPTAPAAGEPRIEHFAFRAEGLADFLAHLRGLDVAYRISVVPDLDLRQVNIHDPDGNHIEVSFPAEEQADLSDYPAAR
jgi:catechol 2,3-dioxygenase-like lactoylglutathione lyase family enzyme